MNRELIAALVGDRTDLYHRSATFYHGINTLAQMLPMMVDGLALNAEHSDAEREAAMAALMRPQPWQPRWPIPGRD